MDLAIYGSHDSSVCIRVSADQYRIYEFERLTGKRYESINKNQDIEHYLKVIWNLIRNEYGIDNYDTCFYAQLESEHLQTLQSIFRFSRFEEMPHHISHAAGAFYQSFFEDALIFSYDSGGHDLSDGVNTFCIFLANKRENKITRIATIPIDVCGPYTMLAVPCSEIRKNDVYSEYLSYAGKIMGLSAYGIIKEEWIDHLIWFYHQNPTIENLEKLGEKIGHDLSGINKLNFQNSADLAATSQHVFEKLTMLLMAPYVVKYKLPIILTGGGALNVLLNQKIKDDFDLPVFVPVNPNDCGLSFGMMAYKWPPDNNPKCTNVMYSGIGLLDKDYLLSDNEELTKKYEFRKSETKELARLLAAGKIIGVVRGNSEVGPRALGNRSILCYPGLSSMKDEINIIKQREFYRPFAPAVKADKISDYFCDSHNLESPYMSFCPTIKPQYENLVPAVVHVDNTARVQTVSKEDNSWLWELIDNVETITGIGMLLNTSFNIKGQPILTKIKDALSVLDETKLDYLYINDLLISKR